ncbi:MAG: TonB-dependent receptor [Blastocatellia bacterium]|nr:TonB-dependent receptor [Blastocatellia bacterium]
MSKQFFEIVRKTICQTLLLFLFTSIAFSQQNRGALKGQLLDETGAAIPNTEISATDASGNEFTSMTSTNGNFEIKNLASGEYVVRVSVPGFSLYNSDPIVVGNRATTPLIIKLRVESTIEQVTVSDNAGVSLSSSDNASAVVLKEKDLESLPDDPDELASALRELAGPSAGPNGAQLFVDGFNGARIPPKSSIREVRINSNPFSAEYSQIGFGRIEILTKPGTDQLHGEGSFAFNDESLNGRNAFAPFRAPLQVRRYGGNITGSIIPKKASFFLDFQRRDVDENATSNVTILDNSFNSVPFSSVIVTPQIFTNFSGRLDYQVDTKSTFSFRYSIDRTTNENQGVGNFELPSRAFNTSIRNQNIALTYTTIFSARVINEARLQLIKRTFQNQDVDSSFALVVSGAFTGGGAQNGRNSQNSERFEFQDFVSLIGDKHNIKLGGLIRGGRVADTNRANFGGTFIFAGDVERDPQTGQPIGGPITSLEQYRRTLLGLPGYRPSQFTLRAGNPFASVNQYDLGLFFQDEWKVKQNFTLSLGLRYENQTNINSKFNFAPRIAFAYSPFMSNGQAKTVIRAGLGIFYDRFDDGFILNSRRLDGTRVTQFFTNQTDFFPNIPLPLQLNAQTPIRQQVASGLTAPYVMQGVVGVEQQLPKKFTLSASYFWSRGIHQLRSRNINAPLPGTFTVPGSGIRPFGNVGDIYLYESTGISNLHQLRLSLNRSLSRTFSIFSSYTYSFAKTDTEGAGVFPANSFDLSGEYARSSFQPRHSLFIGSSTQLPFKMSLFAFSFSRSGLPFNIVTGIDRNGDTLFTERPSFATPGTPGSITTKFGTFNPNPTSGEKLIPRNFGDGPSFFNLNLNLSRNFGFGKSKQAAVAQVQQGTPNIIAPRPGGGPGGGGPGGGGGGRFGGFGNATSSDSRYNLTISARVSNLFNRTNLTSFAGSLTSPIFGQPNSSREARRIEVQLRFRF